MQDDPVVAASRLAAVMNRMRVGLEAHQMSVLMAQCFFYIAANPGVTQRKLLEAVKTGDSVASRTLATLSHSGVRGTKALHLVKLEENPVDRREKLLSLTARGEMVMAAIMTDLRGKSAPIDNVTEFKPKKKRG
jgi:DNA-binding MarR family transcriptional regulator